MHKDSPATKARLNFLKIILLIAGIAVALYLALNRVQFQNKAAAPKTAILSLASSPTSVNVGQSFTVTVTLNTGGSAIRGVDIRMSYDKTKVQPTAITTTASGTTLKTFAPITTANVFDSSKVITSAGTNCSGNTCYLEFGAVTANLTGPAPTPTGVTAAYNGTTSLALVTFTALTAGSASINLESVTNATIDSNVVADINPPEDILSSVTNTSVSIAAGVTPTPTGTTCTNNTCLDFDTTPNGTVDVSDIQRIANRLGSTPNYAVRYDIRCPKVSPIDISDVQYMANRIGTATCTAP